MPRSSAVRAYSAVSVGVRCAERTRTSCGTPNSLSVSAVARMVSQSDLLPMITATSGFESIYYSAYTGEGAYCAPVLNMLTRASGSETLRSSA